MICNRPVLDLLDGFVDHEEWHQKPFTRHDRIDADNGPVMHLIGQMTYSKLTFPPAQAGSIENDPIVR